jgi:hypothetical protein
MFVRYSSEDVSSEDTFLVRVALERDHLSVTTSFGLNAGVSRILHDTVVLVAQTALVEAFHRPLS